MARKAIRLHDVLIAIGGADNRRLVVSNHILNQSSSLFAGKKIALIDDTLILGATLARAERFLRSAGAASVETHVFYVDKSNWCPEIVQPVKIFGTVDHARLLRFCAAEVAALAVTGIPYLSDFPFSQPFRILPTSLNLLDSLSSWQAHTIPNLLRGETDAFTLSFIPSSEKIDSIKTALPRHLFKLIDIVKVRLFMRKSGNHYWTRMVPIVTLNPLAVADVDRLFEAIVEALDDDKDFDGDSVQRYLCTPLARLHFVQYVLSVCIGVVFAEDLAKILHSSARIVFDTKEACRHFGPWLQKNIDVVHREARPLFRGVRFGTLAKKLSLQPAPLPPDVSRTVEREYDDFVGHRRPSHMEETRPNDLITDLTTAFVEMYRRHELPAREEVRRHGAGIFDASTADAPHRDRLQYGFAWRALSEHLLKKRRMDFTQRRSNRLSLILDYLIDTGIAVPVLCERDGVLFRGYRHGEDVLLGEEGVALSFEIVEGFLAGGSQQHVTRLTLEKLLAILLQVSAAKEFLVLNNGDGSHDESARVGFYLHGAVPILSEQDTYFANHRENRLSQYLLERGVLQENSARQYTLSEKPEAAFLNREATWQVHQLGELLGQLRHPPSGESPAPLLESDLVLLTTCGSPRNMAAALSAELRIFNRWYGRRFRREAQRLDWSSLEGVKRCHLELVGADGYTALNSSRVKIVGYHQKAPAAIVERCANYFREQPNGGYVEAFWRSMWDHILSGVSDEEAHRFAFWIEKMATLLLGAAVGVFVCELSLLSRVSQAADRDYDDACTKIKTFLDAMEPFVKMNRHTSRVALRLHSVVGKREPLGQTQEALEYGISLIERAFAEMQAAAAQAHAAVANFGHSRRRLNFAYAIWYDMIDSKGAKGGLHGEALQEYRGRVKRFRQDIREDLDRLRTEAARHESIVYAWQGHIHSNDDERHIFFARNRAATYMQQTLRILLGRASALGVCLRVICVRANFTGMPAFKEYTGNPNVYGDSFFEHLSVLKAQLRQIEDQRIWNVQGAPPLLSIVWLLGGMAKYEDLACLIEESGRQNGALSTVVDDHEILTDYAGGPVAFDTRQS